MSTTPDTQSLGYDRLSVRSPSQPVTRPESGQSAFREKLDFGKLALTGETEYRSVAEGESRRIETVADAIEAFEEYLDNKENASIVLEKMIDDGDLPEVQVVEGDVTEELEESEEVRVLPYNHRWTQEYRRMVYAKLKAAEEGLESIFGDGPIPTTLLTLTARQTDENGKPRPPGAVLDDLLDGWDKFRKVLDRVLDGTKTEYIRVVEPHESGFPHIHVVIFGAARPSIQGKIEDMWVEKYGVGGEAAHAASVSVARGRSAQLQEPAAYVMKYLGKTTVRSDGADPAPSGKTESEVEAFNEDAFTAFSALLWVTGRRQYSASKGVSSAMSRGGGGDSTASWRFVGVAKGVETGRYKGDDAERLMRHLSSGPWRPPPPSAAPGHTPNERLLSN